MKKYIFLLAILSLPAFGAPSVRALGNVAAPVSGGTSTIKATPVRISSTKLPANVNSLSRVGSTRPASVSSVAGAITSSAARIPVAPIKPYSITSQQSGTSSNKTSEVVPSGGCCNIDVETIVRAILADYYDKTEVYNNADFVTAVTELIPDSAEDPRIDAVRIVGSANREPPATVWADKNLSLPADYVYIWVEE